MNTTDFDMLITHPDRDVRLRAAMDAGSLRDAGVTDILVSRIAVEEDFHVRENLTWALVQQGEDAAPAVRALLTSENPLERRQATHILSKVGDPAHVAQILPVALYRATSDEDPEVALAAVMALGAVGGDVAHASLQDVETAGRQPLEAVARRLLKSRMAT